MADYYFFTDVIRDVPNTFYEDELITYNENYDKAIDSMQNLYAKFNSLYDIFDSASGSDVILMKNDLSSIIKSLESILDKVVKAKEKSNKRAKNSDSVIVLVKGAGSPSSKASTGKTYENLSNPSVCVTRDGGLIVEETCKETITIISEPQTITATSCHGHTESYSVGGGTSEYTYDKLLTSIVNIDSMLEGVLKYDVLRNNE